LEASRSHDRRDDYRGCRKSRSVRIHHHLLGQLNIGSHAFSRIESNPSVPLVRNHRRRPELDIFQGELKKLKPPLFDG